MDTLIAQKRDLNKKAKVLRREGYVVGILYGSHLEESVPVMMTKSDVAQILKDKTKGSQIMLDVEGQQYDVLIKELDFNPLKGSIDAMDFQALVKGEKVHSVAEVVLLHHEKVVEGIIEEKLQEISYKATPEALVDKIEIDVSEMRVGDEVKVKDLEIAKKPGVVLVTDPEEVVVMITEAHLAKEADDEEADAEETPAE